MLRAATCLLRHQLKCNGAARVAVAVGTRCELEPIWPLPLPAALPRHRRKNTLVLDIDETLIHTFGMCLHVPQSTDTSDGLAQVPLVDYHVVLRPHLQQFLREVDELFEIIFWTAGTASYCSAILNMLEQQVMGLPASFYNLADMIKALASTDVGRDRHPRRHSSHAEHPTHREHANDEGMSNHANFYALSRTQTLQKHGYMKYLPMLGRPMRSVCMLDDNVRSFPLNPRHGIKIAPFDPDDRVLQRYITALQRRRRRAGVVHTTSQNGIGGLPIAATVAIDQHVPSAAESNEDTEEDEDLSAGLAELYHLESDRALLDILPVLRAVGTTPYGSNVTHELDHWRNDNYVGCDDFNETMNPLSLTRLNILGATTTQRNATPIPRACTHISNIPFIENANAESKLHQTEHFRANL